jgi:hypothetical protein
MIVLGNSSQQRLSPCGKQKLQFLAMLIVMLLVGWQLRLGLPLHPFPVQWQQNPISVEIFPTLVETINNSNIHNIVQDRTSVDESTTAPFIHQMVSTSLIPSFQGEDPMMTIVDCGCPATCTDKVLNRKLPVRNEHAAPAPFTCRQRIQKYMNSGRSQKEACSIAVEEEFTSCDSSCDPNHCMVTEHVTGLTDSTGSPVVPTYRNNGTEHILILAAVPRSYRHTVALWSELECLASRYDSIIVSSPDWSRPMMEEILKQARESLGLKLESKYYINDRYDVGLWCDAIKDLLRDKMDKIKTVTLLNDSVYAFRLFTGILDALQRRPHDLDMVSINYYNHSGGYWLESVMRGFPIRSMPIFVNRICEAPKQLYCPNRGPQKRKRCIVENFEIAVAGNFYRNRTMGLFPSNPPSDWPRADRIWAEQPKFWKMVLVDQMRFPLAKVKATDQLTGPNDARLAECTKTLDQRFLSRFNYSR